MEADVVILSGVGARLRAERERLRLNQEEFGGLAAVTRNSQATYEAGKRPFSIDYILALKPHGIDIVYVLTGERLASALDDDQARLISAFDAMSPSDRDAVLRLSGSLAGLRGPSASIKLPSTAALTEAFGGLLEASPGLDGDGLAHELAKRLPTILRVAQGALPSALSDANNAPDAPLAVPGADRRATQRGRRT